MKNNTTESTGKVAIHELVYREIRQSIMVGTFVPGQKVSLRNLAEQVGTSLTPVRGAVNRLIAEGAFQMMPNRWVAIPSMSEKKFDEIVHWRLRLEAKALKMANKHISSSDIDRLEEINQNMIISAKAGDRRDLLSNNYDFHFTIYEASGSHVLLPMIESLWLQCGPFTYYSLLSPTDLWDAAFHRQIISALKKGDSKAGIAALKNDIMKTAEFLKENGQYETPKLKKVLA